jgi:hypothetical protein
MAQQGAGGGQSKLDSGRAKLVESLNLLGSNRWVLIDSATQQPLELESPAALSTLPQTAGVSASADLPALLQAAHDYIHANRPSRTEVWICSDLRQHDWDADSGRWQVLRDSFLDSTHPVRFHLLAYPEAAPRNRSIRITEVRREQNSSGAELLVSLRVEQLQPSDGTATFPIQFEIDGARSELAVEMAGTELELKNHSIPLDVNQTRGWGRVSLPADANPIDNEFYFVYDQPAPRRTIIVAEDADAARPLELAASISPDPAITASAELLTLDQLASADWTGVSLVLWQAPLPSLTDAALSSLDPSVADASDAGDSRTADEESNGEDAGGETDETPASGDVSSQLEAFLNRGGQVIFFPPESPTDAEFAGLRWDDWQELSVEAPISTWIGDQDLLANTRSGASLPVGQLSVTRYCELTGDHTSLATLQGGATLLGRATTDQRNVYFCATSAAPNESSLARDGVVLYVMIQRALASGASSLGLARQYIAGKVPRTSTTAEWRLLAGSADALSSDYPVQAGVYQDGEKLLAINRSDLEDRSAVVPDARVAALFDRLDFDRVDDQAGSGTSLLQETWRLFLALMMAALLVEAFLCLPRLSQAARNAAGAGTGQVWGPTSRPQSEAAA